MCKPMATHEDALLLHYYVCICTHRYTMFCEGYTSCSDYAATGRTKCCGVYPSLTESLGGDGDLPLSRVTGMGRASGLGLAARAGHANF